MCFIAVGMAEVSTCEVTVQEGQVLKKGDQMGIFHFGGSTHASYSDLARALRSIRTILLAQMSCSMRPLRPLLEAGGGERFDL
ncbi:hypothetical protein DFS33DRAFT_1358746 [Desarmillaria ectypa]|nr:hypothetical protein DFS33DRAFT_1358746 [Desarmillaria ectypa]